MFKRIFVFLRDLVFPAAPSAPELPHGRINPAEKLSLGRRAESLLGDDLLNAVFEAVSDKYRAAWENAARGDIETQRVAHMSLAAIKDVQGALRAHLGNARIFEADLVRQKERAAAKNAH